MFQGKNSKEKRGSGGDEAGKKSAKYTIWIKEVSIRTESAKRTVKRKDLEQRGLIQKNENKTNQTEDLLESNGSAANTKIF